MKIRENVSLKKYNTFGIEAYARYFAEVNSLEEIKEILSEKKELPRLILGGGSNMLLTKDFNGIVIKVNLKGISLIKVDDHNFYVRSAAGENWNDFVNYCVEHRYAGIENLSLIPGNVGAGPMQNIGAYGVELKDVFYELEAYNIESAEINKFNKEECHFGYRDSIFKNEGKEKYIITSVTLRLNKIPVYNTSYGAIEKELEEMGVKELSIAAISKAVCNIRRSKLPDPAQIGNAGSFFKNPVVPIQKFESLKKDFPDIPGYKNSDTEIKLAAGWLIEQCGWKGKTFGETGVHKNQALVLVNYGNAKGKEVFELSQKVLDSVKEKFGVLLEREVNII